ncbi:MAG TPA: hypothetical protein VMM37_11165, partial [Bacteroidota bacterium]|nr:hypothetical protein [Bacteroidota bacterium]
MLRALVLLLIPLSLCGQTPGPKDNRVLLPNAWWLSPAGEQIQVGDLPMNAALYDGRKPNDQRYLAVLDGGQSGADVRLVDLVQKTVVDSVKLKDAWQGIRFAGDLLYVSGGFQNCVYRFQLNEGRLTAVDTISFELPKPKYAGGAAGLDVFRNTLAVVFRYDSTLRYANLKTKTTDKVKLPGMPYSCVYANDGTLLVSLWSSAKVQAYRGTQLLYEFKVGDHPNEITLSANSHYAYVANANDNSVSVIDLKARRTIAHASTSIHPDSPEGSTTNSVTLTANSRYLLAANADNNSLTVMKWQ